MSPDILGWFGGRGGARLRLEQSLGAFPLENGDISPLYVLFGVSNPNETAITAQEAHLRAGPDTTLDITGELGGDGDGGDGGDSSGNSGGLPREIPPGGAATLWVRARELAGRLQRAGHAGTPRLKLVILDSAGGEHTTAFRLRVDEYLRLEDE